MNRIIVSRLVVPSPLGSGDPVGANPDATRIVQRGVRFKPIASFVNGLPATNEF